LNTGASSAPSAETNSGHSGRNSGYRGNNRNMKSPPGASLSTFKGRFEGMNGHIYDVPSSGNNNQFDETTKELENFIGSSMLFKDSGGAVRKAVGQLGQYENLTQRTTSLATVIPTLVNVFVCLRFSTATNPRRVAITKEAMASLSTMWEKTESV
jgi:hypothetical protein